MIMKRETGGEKEEAQVYQKMKAEEAGIEWQMEMITEERRKMMSEERVGEEEMNIDIKAGIIVERERVRIRERATEKIMKMKTRDLTKTEEIKGGTEMKVLIEKTKKEEKRVIHDVRRE